MLRRGRQPSLCAPARHHDTVPDHLPQPVLRDLAQRAGDDRRDAGIEPTVVEYLKTPYTREQLAGLLQAMGLRPRELLRTKGDLYGELGLADHMAEGMKRARTGQEVRMADIPADAGQGLGAFDLLRQHADSAKATRNAYLKQFNIGQRTLLDLLDTENERFVAELNYIDGKYRVLYAQYRIIASKGQLLGAMGVTPPDGPRWEALGHDAQLLLGGEGGGDDINVTPLMDIVFIMLIFFIVHIYFATTGHTPTAHIKAMITGWEEVD